MQLIKKSVIFGLLILVVLLGFSMFLPRNISITRSVELPEESTCPAQLVSNLSNWHLWFPALKSKFSTIELQTENSAVLTNNTGMATQLTALPSKPDSFAFQLSSINSNPVDLVFVIQPGTSGHSVLHMVVNTTLKWYPWQRFRAIFMDKVLGPQYEEALENIRKECNEHNNG